MILLRAAALHLDTHKEKVNQALAFLFHVPFGTIPGAYHKC